MKVISPMLLWKGFGFTVWNELHYMQTYTKLSRMKYTRLLCVHLQRCSQMRKPGALTCVYPNGHRTQKSSLPSKEGRSGISPHGYVCVLLHLSSVVWVKAQPGNPDHLSVLPNVCLRQNQPSPILTPPSSLEFCPKSHWRVAQTNSKH